MKIKCVAAANVIRNWAIIVMAKARFGKNIKFKEFKAEKGFLSGLISGGENRLSLPDTLAQTLEEKSMRGRYGL